jgi:protocatechuate 3,4-dioxygenase beta subunit
VELNLVLRLKKSCLHQKLDKQVRCHNKLPIGQPKAAKGQLPLSLARWMRLTNQTTFMRTISFLLLVLLTVSSNAQTKNDRIVGGGCEGCEAIFEYGNRKLNAVDTLPDFNLPGPKMKVTGTIFKHDAKTPAKDIVLYIYHTDQSGIYPKRGDETGWAKRHGYIRGWIKTDADGRYTFYTLRPGAYPGRQNPEHIHPTVKEAGVKEYWIDEYLFDDDPILTAKERARQEGRGGKGIIKPTKDKSGMQIVKRDIILGLNVPGYE